MEEGRVPRRRIGVTPQAGQTAPDTPLAQRSAGCAWLIAAAAQHGDDRIVDLEVHGATGQTRLDRCDGQLVADLRAHPRQLQPDAATIEFVEQLAKGLGAGRVDVVDRLHVDDHRVDVTVVDECEDLVAQEWCIGEEERSVEAVDHEAPGT